MYSLETIKKLNRLKAARLHVRLARATNNPGGHAKDGEKGRSAKKSQCVISARQKGQSELEARNREWMRAYMAAFTAMKRPYTRAELIGE